MRAYERFLHYAKVNTQSAEGTGKSPSTDCQWELARLLERGLFDGLFSLFFSHRFDLYVISIRFAPKKLLLVPARLDV